MAKCIAFIRRYLDELYIDASLAKSGLCKEIIKIFTTQDNVR